MCEICGGPHFTIKCPNSLGYSTHCYSNLNTQQQPSTAHYLQNFYDRLDKESKTYKNFVTIDDPDEINLHSVLWYMKYGSDPDYKNSLNDLNDQNDTLNVSCENEDMQESQEELETIMVDSDPPPVLHEEQEKKKSLIIDFSKSQEEIDAQLAEYKKWQKDQEGKPRKLIIDFSKSQEEIDAQLAEYKKWQKENEEKKEEQVEEPKKPVYGYTYDGEGNYLGYTTHSGELITIFPEPGKELYIDDVENDEENTLETETTMDAEVPPPKQKVEDNFWSDSEDEEAEAEAWAAYQRKLLLRKEFIEENEIEEINVGVGWLFNDNVEEKEVEEIELTNCLEFMFGVEEVVEKESSWEDEFLGELEGIPQFIDEEIDPERDLDELEALLEGRRIEKMDPIVVEFKCEDPPIEIMEDKGHYCWPVEEMDDGSQIHAKPQEKVKKRRLPDNQIRRKKKRFKDVGNRSSYGLSRIVFDRGKFNRYNSDPFEFLNVFLNSTKIKFLIINNHRVELNGLDRVQIKEKPPD